MKLTIQNAIDKIIEQHCNLKCNGICKNGNNHCPYDMAINALLERDDTTKLTGYREKIFERFMKME